MLGLLIIAIIILTALSGFFSCSEVAFFSLPASKVRGFRSNHDPKKRLVARILTRSKSLLVTIFMYNTIVNVLLQNTSSELFASSTSGWLLKVGFPLVLVLFVGELVPKYLGLIYNERLALRFAPSIEWFEWIITPLRVCVTRIAYVLSRVFFFFLKAEPPLSKEELAHILQSSEGKGILNKDELNLIYGVLNLEDKQIKELMWPRNEMPVYGIDEPLSKLNYLFSEEMLLEVAVFEMPQDKMLGVIRARDFFIKRNSIQHAQDLIKILRKPFYVPETTSAKAVLQQLHLDPTNTAWIVDEYGTTCGMITEEDLLGEIVGTAPKSSSEKPEFERISKTTIVASGTMPLDDVRKLFNVALDSKYHMATIGGFITERLGTIPQAGATFEEDHLFMRVLSSDPTRIRKVYLQMKAAS